LLHNSPTAAAAVATGMSTAKWHIAGRHTGTTAASSNTSAFDTLAKRYNASMTTDNNNSINSSGVSSSSNKPMPAQGIAYSVERTVFVHNLAFSVTESELTAHMQLKIGKVNTVQLHYTVQRLCICGLL
jgi:RNA recognition motif-containing protein